MMVPRRWCQGQDKEKWPYIGADEELDTEGGRALVQAAQEGHGLFLWRHSNPTCPSVTCSR